MSDTDTDIDRLEELREILNNAENISRSVGSIDVRNEDDVTLATITVCDVARLAEALSIEIGARVHAEREHERWESRAKNAMEEVEFRQTHMEEMVERKVRELRRSERDEHAANLRKSRAADLRTAADMLAKASMETGEPADKVMRRVYLNMLAMANEVEAKS